LNRSNVLGPSVSFLPRKSVQSDPRAIAAEGSVTLVDQDQSYVLLEAASRTSDGFSEGEPNPQGINKGVINTEPAELPTSKRAQVSLDWLTVTIPREVVDLAHKSPYALVDLLGLPVEHVLDEGRGESGYTALYTLDVPGARLRVGGNAGTASLQLSGGALDHFEEAGLDLFGWMQYVNDLQAKATRLDWAFDDYNGALEFETLTQGIRDGGDGDLVTVYRSKPQLQGSKVFGGDDWTIYFGSKDSETRVRIYDKRAEQEAKAQEVTRPQWIRTEIQLRKDKAAKAFKTWCNRDFETKYALGVLRGRVDFRVPTEDTNRTRWPVAQWWGAFVGAVEVEKVKVEGRTRDYEAMKQWLHTQVAKSLAILEDVEGRDAVGALIGDGRGRYNDHDCAFRDSILIDQTDRPPGDTFLERLKNADLVIEIDQEDAEIVRRRIRDRAEAWVLGAI
jgi:DNA relaxase NicK